MNQKNNLQNGTQSISEDELKSSKNAINPIVTITVYDTVTGEAQTKTS